MDSFRLAGPACGSYEQPLSVYNTWWATTDIIKLIRASKSNYISQFYVSKYKNSTYKGKYET
jgi:hypothetical protein